MKDNDLLKDEHIITQSDSKTLTLTNLRLRYSTSSWGRSNITNFLLESVSAVEVKYKSKSHYILIAILSIIGGLIAGAEIRDDYAVLGVGLGVFLLILYVISRKRVLSISSSGGIQIHFHTKSMKRGKVL